MRRSFQSLNDFLDIVMAQSGWDAQCARRDCKRGPAALLVEGNQPGAQQAVDGGFVGVAGRANFIVDQLRNIGIERQSCSHILMLHSQTS